MYIRYGAYLHSSAEVALTTEKHPINQGGIQVGVEETWTLTGFLQAASQSALVTALTNLELAYSLNHQTIQLILPDGSTIARQMPGVHPLGGTEVIEGVSYPVDGTGNNGAEFTSYRTYTVKVKGRYALADPPGGTLVQWDEALTFQGGGPHDEYITSQLGLPQLQRLKEFTPFFAMQVGSATGLLSWPTPPPPFWPLAEKRPQRRITPRSPTRRGDSYTEFSVEWSYEFHAAAPLIGVPGYWR